MQIEVRGDRPLVPRLDAARGPEPARARRRDPGRGGGAARARRGLPRPTRSSAPARAPPSGRALETPSDCAVPERFTFRLDRRLTIGEIARAGAAPTSSRSRACGAARAAGLAVGDRGCRPTTSRPGAGYVPGNPQVYLGWADARGPPRRSGPRSPPTAAWSTPHVGRGHEGGGALRPRAARRPLAVLDRRRRLPGAGGRARRSAVPARKRWVTLGRGAPPGACSASAPGIEQNAHTIGECVDMRELRHAIAFLARFPSVVRGDGGLIHETVDPNTHNSPLGFTSRLGLPGPFGDCTRTSPGTMIPATYPSITVLSDGRPSCPLR